MKAGKWDKKSFTGCELLGKTLGLVGIGNVGSVVARCAVGIGMKVIACDPFVAPEKAAALGLRLTDFDEVIRAVGLRLRAFAPDRADEGALQRARPSRR